jgi:hypothetical protein
MKQDVLSFLGQDYVVDTTTVDEWRCMVRGGALSVHLALDIPCLQPTYLDTPSP